VGEEEARGGRELRTRRGSLTDLAGYVERLYMEPGGRYLFIAVPDKRGMLWLVRQNGGGFGLVFVVDARNKELGRVGSELCGKNGFEERSQGESKVVGGPVPEMWLEATEIVEKVIRGYQVSDNTRLLFSFGSFQGKAFFEK
jgi:hypothetical protein